MTRTYNFPHPCTIMHFINKGGLPAVKLPYLSDMDDEFWGLPDDYSPKNKLTISTKEGDDYSSSEHINHLVYNEDGVITVWIIVYNVDLSISRFWVIGAHTESSDEEEEANRKLREWAKNELL